MASMAPLDTAVGDNRHRSQWRRWSPWRSALLFAVVGSAVAVLADRWHAGVRREAAGRNVAERMGAHAEALRAAADRRMALLAGLRSFAASRRTRTQLDEEFPLFAAGTITGVDGVRALQFIEKGRIVATYPLTGNEAALGYDLLNDPRAEISGDVQRALVTGRVTVTGPVTLLQGGTGLLVRQRLSPRTGFPDLAAIVLDVPTLVREAGIPSLSGLRLEVHDRNGTWFAGDLRGSTAEPERVAVAVADGDWTLLGSPTDGWSSLMASSARDFRVAAALLILAVGFIGFLVGSRERELALQVRDAGSQLEFALRAGRMGSWAWDVRTNSVQWSASAARLVGFDASRVADPIGRLLDAVHPDDRDTVKRVVRSIARGEHQQYYLEYRLRRAEGGYRWISAIGELERDHDGAPAILAGVVSDATERRELEERVRHAERMEAIGQLAGGVAHDFNNLLTAMRGFSQLALARAKELGDSPAAVGVREDLGEALATVDRGVAITSQLLAFSRRIPVEPKAMDLAAAIREVAPMLGRLLTTRIRLETELADDLPLVLMDHGQFTQVVMNLLVNARDAMPDGGRIVVRAYAVPPADPRVPRDGVEGATVCVEVEDHGRGMAPEVKARLFEPYFTTKEQGKGTGLGLPVVLAAVERAGGAVDVLSTPGMGATFRIFLPALPDRLVAAGRHEHSPNT
jgi:PAS domain S-box-containing protein